MKLKPPSNQCAGCLRELGGINYDCFKPSYKLFGGKDCANCLNIRLDIPARVKLSKKRFVRFRRR